MYRKTYVEIDGNILENNIREIKEKYNDYEYYFGVVKANAYSHGFESIEYLLKGGINYLAVSSLEEALKVRSLYKNIPILILEPIHYDDILVAAKNNITITLDDVNIFDKLKKNKIAVKYHIKVDSGMNRFGFKDKNNVKYVYDNSNETLFLEGLFTHFGSVGGESLKKELSRFEDITNLIDLKKIPIVHLERSLSLECHKRLPYGNGIRLGILMYGFNKTVGSLSWKRKLYNMITFKKYKPIPSILHLHTALKFYTEVLEIKEVEPGDNIGYAGMYKAEKRMKIAILPYGFGDYAHIKPGTVVINGTHYKTITNYMDITVAIIDDTVKPGDKVEIFGDIISIRDEARKLGINAYKVMCGITNRVPRIYKYNNKTKEANY